MNRTFAMKGAGCWRLILVRYASRRVRRLLFEAYLNPAWVMSDEPNSLSRNSIGMAFESVLRERAVLAPRIRC